MENATRALLIAAAVLLAICLISLSLMVFNSSSGMTNQASSTLDSTAVYTHNSKFLSYINKSASSTTTKSLVTTIMQNNAIANSYSSSTSFSADAHHVYLNFYPKDENSVSHKWKTKDLSKIHNKISVGAKYKIYVTKGCTKHSGGYYNGYLCCISIKEL